MDENALHGIELVKTRTAEILEYAARNKGDRLLVVFYEEELHSIETFDVGRARLKEMESPLDIPFSSLEKGMDKAQRESSETAVVMTFITISGVSESVEDFEVSCGVMSCEKKFFVVGPDDVEDFEDDCIPINTLMRGEA